MKIVHIITGLSNGGAEMMLYKLIKYQKQRNITVISLNGNGVMSQKIQNLGIEVKPFFIKKDFINLKKIIEILTICKGADVIQSWMYHADLLSFLISLVTNPKILIWGIRRSNLEKKNIKNTTLIIAKLNAKISKSKRVNKIVSCSREGIKTHVKLGYVESKFCMIPNGFCLEKYKYKYNNESLIRSELKISDDIKIFSLVGRWEKLKDHKNFLNTLKILKKEGVKFVGLLCGTDINYSNEDLVKLIKERDLTKEIKLLGRREDINCVMSATDIYISSSSGEGFSNVIGEAMACQTPCVVTDVGDSSYIVGNTGKVVPKNNSELLAKAVKELLQLNDLEIKELGKKARKRIIDNFEINRVVKMYENLYFSKKKEC